MQDEVILSHAKKLAEADSEEHNLLEAVAHFLIEDREDHFLSPEELEDLRETAVELVGYGIERNPDMLNRLAGICGWFRAIFNIAQAVKYYDYKPSSAEWKWIWLKDTETVERFRKGLSPTFSPANIGYEMGDGLLRIIEAGLVEIPEESKVTFAVAYARWYQNTSAANADVSQLVRVLWGLWENVPEHLVQVLACFDSRAGEELAIRKLRPRLPLAQRLRFYGQALLRNHGVRPTSLEDAAGYWKSGEACKRWLAWRFYSKRITKPDDPLETIEEIKTICPEAHETEVSWWEAADFILGEEE